MRVAFTHNLRFDSSVEQAEFDDPATVEAIASALIRAGHEVEKVEVSGRISELVTRLETLAPDMIFNTAEGAKGRFREGFYPALFEQMDLPYTGSDAYVCTTTLDKRATKMLVDAYGIPTPRWQFVDNDSPLEVESLRFPVIVKPNFEGSSKGISADSVVESVDALKELVATLLDQYPAGILVEEFIVGRDLVVPFIEGVSAETGGVLEPAVYDYRAEYAAAQKYTVYDYSMKTNGFDAVSVRVPADISEETRAMAMRLSKRAFQVLGVRDMGRIDFRVTDEGSLYFLEVNALPSLEEGASIFLSAGLIGLKSPAQVLDAIIQSAARRQPRTVSPEVEFVDQRVSLL